MWAWRAFLLATVGAIMLLVLGGIANFAYPRGPMVPTGVKECATEQSGPCAEVHEEDIDAIRHRLPGWVYAARQHNYMMWGCIVAAVGVVGTAYFSQGERRGRRRNAATKRWLADFRRTHGRDPTGEEIGQFTESLWPQEHL